MRELYPKLERCSVLVLASPIYYLSLSAQTTLFLNRTYPLFNPEGPRFGARKLIACLTYGDADPIGSGCDIAARILRDLCAYFGISMDLVHASALNKGEVKRNRPAMERAFELGRAAANVERRP
jgi:multimeric flavodoxin WrbA